MPYTNKLYDFVVLLRDHTAKGGPAWDPWKIGQAAINVVEDFEVTSEYLASAMTDADPNEFSLNITYVRRYLAWGVAWAGGVKQAIVSTLGYRNYALNSEDDIEPQRQDVIHNGIRLSAKDTLFYYRDETSIRSPVIKLGYWVRLKPGTWGPRQSWSLPPKEAFGTEKLIPPLRIIGVANV